MCARVFVIAKALEAALINIAIGKPSLSATPPLHGDVASGSALKEASDDVAL
jgi:hypothetical protein